MSNEQNIFERLWKLYIMIGKMILDGVRDPHKVADALQVIVDTATIYRRQLCVVELGPTEGNETFGLSGLFTGGIYGLAVPVAAKGKATLATKATVWEMILDGVFALLFGSLGEERKRWTEAQVVRFCRDHPDKLRTDGYATFFEMEGDVVASVRVVDDGQLKVHVRSFSDDFVWRAKYQHRIVSLKLAVSPLLVGLRSFLFKTLLPSAKHATYLI